MFFVLPRAWDKETIVSPHEDSNLRPLDSALRCSMKFIYDKCPAYLQDQRCRQPCVCKQNKKDGRFLSLVKSMGQRKRYSLHFLLKSLVCNKEYYFQYEYELISASKTSFSPSSAPLDGLEDSFSVNVIQAQILCQLLLGTAQRRFKSPFCSQVHVLLSQYSGHYLFCVFTKTKTGSCCIKI